MDFKHINDKTRTPKTDLARSRRVVPNCDSPFRSLPNFSTPPSRFSKIVNPFETYLMDTLHLPTFSPTVFAQSSTTKPDEKFKWTIEDISSLKPADIDEATIDQHVFDEDPHKEYLVQEKINRFFSEKVIVPSPLNQQSKSVPLLIHSQSSPATKPKVSNGTTQTILTLPPILPEHVEMVLAPYFNYVEDHQEETEVGNLILYKKLFENSPIMENEQRNSRESSPALSTGLSPLQFSPLPLMGRHADGSMELHTDLDDCNLSPISRKSPKASRSACRLSFTERMSVDVSMTVPDIKNELSITTNSNDENFVPVANDVLSDSTVNWDMEYKHISMPQVSGGGETMDMSLLDTPHSKMFTSQRKRLSDSFKDDDDKEFFSKKAETNILKKAKNKISAGDFTDAGYMSASIVGEDSNWNVYVFASTPSKKLI